MSLIDPNGAIVNDKSTGPKFGKVKQDYDLVIADSYAYQTSLSNFPANFNNRNKYVQNG